MLKKMVDDPDGNGGVRLTGTFIQKVYGLDEHQIKECCKHGDYKAFFDYKYGSEKDKVRRTLPIKENDKEVGTRTTIDVSIQFGN